MSASVLFIIFISAIIPGYLCNELPLVETKLGLVQGSIKTSFEGRQFSAFEGIPYAEPPIGKRRFEEPKPKKAWDGTWKANFLATCPQPDFFGNGTANGTDENCLFLNVYVPGDVQIDKSLDVIVHIHGGAFQYGSANAYSRPEVLMDHDAIFVTFNYRLGILGFLSTEDEVVPGNNGLKDQTLALKWVQDNIASFGGNPKSITLSGLSAGSCSVHFHYFSELSKGLFHRGISNSGTALNMWALQKGALEKTKKLADSLGCPTTNTKIMVNCLKQKPVQQIVEKLSIFFEYKKLPSTPFTPIVEKKGPNPFLKDDPYLLLMKGEVYDVPWITSSTTHDGTFPALLFQLGIEDIGEKWDDLAPYLLDYNYTVPKSLWKTVAHKVKEEYLGEVGFKEENYFEYLKIFTDRYFAVDAETSVRLQSKVTKSPIYYYIFNYAGDNNPMKVVMHGGDGKYFFGPVFMAGPLTPNELKMRELLIEMLLSFAKTGVPKFGQVEWKPTQDKPLTYLQIDGFESEDIKLETVDVLTNKKFWHSIEIEEGANLYKIKDEL